MSSTPRTPALLLALANRYPSEASIIEVTAALAPSAAEFLLAVANVREDLRYEGGELAGPDWASAREYLIAEWAAELVAEVQHLESGGHHEPLPFGLSLYQGLIRRPDGTGIAVDTLFRGDPDMNEVIALLWGEAEDRATSYVDRKLREVAGAPPPSRSSSSRGSAGVR
jgi:hypothetical protein